MKALVLIVMSLSILAACRVAEGQREHEGPHSTDPKAPANKLASLKTQADEAHKTGHIDEEINYRQQFSQRAWEDFAADPGTLDNYDRYNIVFLNDLPLGLLLEGAHRWPEAEVIFRHNRAALAANPVAGNDVKAENQLLLAYLLASEGEIEGAKSICDHWKSRMRHFAAGQETDRWHGTPRAPLSDTPEVEVAKWNLACGKPQEGLALLTQQVVAHPHMLASFRVLSHYYYSQGDFLDARKAESDGVTAVNAQ